MDMQVCSKCGIEKDLSMFYVRPNGKHRKDCKACHYKNNIRWNLNNKNRVLENTRAWKKTNHEKVLESNRRYHAKNKDKIKERRQKAREENIDKYNEYYREYYKNHKEQHKIHVKNWVENNKDYIAQKQREWSKNNKERHKELIKNWQQAHLEIHALQQRNRRALKKSLGGGWTIEEEIKLLEGYNYRCAYCCKKLDYPTIDHVVPISSGGLHDISNVVPACLSCNSSKSNKPLLVWIWIKNRKELDERNNIWEETHLKAKSIYENNAPQS